MEVTFISIDQENHKIEYKAIAKQDGNGISFSDKSCENTVIYLKIKENKLHLLRQGEVTMEMEFIPKEKTKGYYQNQLGLSFEFDVYCSLCIIKDERIDVHYEMILEDGTTNKQKLAFIIN
ncbi:MAG: DUF1934 domain-containing protein [Anaeroplasmataceae bacterium]|jgi:Domain of unknown function (DUF1934).|nr:DUF1934 domain-containing protein [Anaeroplasmataceae bacterium]HRF70849.1 DUF1934 domain-containing protein [Candidatus Pelethenecus sp.]